jgi:GNAT superfamily N-acetyltransferase
MHLTIQREPIAPLWDDLFPLLARHRAEVAPYPDWELAPDRALYDALDTAGRLRVFTVRGADAAGSHLLGYCILTVAPNPHYTAVLVAHQDVLFILPEHRQGGAGLKLLRHVETALRAEGVHCLAQRTKARPDLHLGPLFARLGYTEIDQVWLKRLDPDAPAPCAAPDRAHSGTPRPRAPRPPDTANAPRPSPTAHHPRRDAPDYPDCIPTPAHD